MYEFGVMAKIVSGIRLSSMLLFVLVSSVSFSTFADPGDKQAYDAASSSSVGHLFYHETLTENQENSTVTIEFNCSIIVRMNRTALESIYLNVHAEILKSLNRRKSTTSISTTPTPTNISTTAGGEPPPVNKRKRKKRESSFVDYDAMDLRLVGNDPEIDENGVLRVSLLLIGKGMDYLDCGITLFDAANQTYKDGILDREAGVPVVTIYRGLPKNRSKMSSQINYNVVIWPLVILFILLFAGIGGFVYWKKHRTTNWRPCSKEKKIHVKAKKMPQSQDP